MSRFTDKAVASTNAINSLAHFLVVMGDNLSSEDKAHLHVAIGIVNEHERV